MIAYVNNSLEELSIPSHCQFQAIWGQFWSTGSMGWNGVLSFTLFINLIRPFKNTTKWGIYFHIYVWMTAIVTTLSLYLLRSDIHEWSIFCTLSSVSDKTTIVLLSVPVVISLLMGLVASSFGLKSLKSTSKDRRIVIIRMMLFTFIFIFCWSGYVASNIYYVVDGTPPTGFILWWSFGVSIQGFVNSFVWFWNPSFYDTVKHTLKKYFNPKEDENRPLMKRYDASNIDIVVRQSVIYDLMEGIKCTTVEPRGYNFDSADDFLEHPKGYKKNKKCFLISTDLFGLRPHTYKMKDFRPLIFHRLRLLNNTTMSSYLSSLSPETFFREKSQQKFSDGRSGSFFCFTSDKKLIIKTIPLGEVQQVLAILPRYHEYLEKHPNSLLPRFYGLYSIDVNYETIYFLVSVNAFSSPLQIHRKFDLKGSWVNREVGASYNEDPEKVMGMDVDFKKSEYRVRVADHHQKVLYERLSQDALFLDSLHLMDYSILLGIHIIQDTAESHQFCDSVDVERFLWVSEDGSEIYVLSIIDILQGYDLKKKLERFFKVTFLRRDKFGLSVQSPKKYYRRFRRFLANEFFGCVLDTSTLS
eukprot:TRINITY_DN1008_c0_g1_i1.p1 TRINITY_DN1008_c0_g1~~TRINITY_DN1008_c0_g1_i1.p1  ORF type:complete len:583 (-),score=57.35 TRINITY_DN1008_c0_g1_i1:282-2030(-)